MELIVATIKCGCPQVKGMKISYAGKCFWYIWMAILLVELYITYSNVNLANIFICAVVMWISEECIAFGACDGVTLQFSC